MFARISRTAARSTSAATISAATESASVTPARTIRRPTRTVAEPSRSLAKWSAFDSSAALWCLRAARHETIVRLASIAITTPSTASAYHAASTSACDDPASRSIARKATNTLARTRIEASPSAARCSALPWP
jgi:hypothetical protein